MTPSRVIASQNILVRNAGVASEDDVNIGANAVVLVDIPAGQTAVGIPAKVIAS
ncbi:MAG: hypothetical protein QNJ41_04475 [Xenococcaceae cyanobacterium MO_188.B32]|nr:hypothetical protein [Xenococcaceae cyanobacterium MO_188.B32]